MCKQASKAKDGFINALHDEDERAEKEPLVERIPDVNATVAGTSLMGSFWMRLGITRDKH